MEIKGAVQPQIPNSSRWQSERACVGTYITNRFHYVTIFDDHPELEDKLIRRKLDNTALYINIKRLQEQHEDIGKALNTVISIQYC